MEFQGCFDLFLSVKLTSTNWADNNVFNDCSSPKSASYLWESTINFNFLAFRIAKIKKAQPRKQFWPEMTQKAQKCGGGRRCGVSLDGRGPCKVFKWQRTCPSQAEPRLTGQAASARSDPATSHSNRAYQRALPPSSPRKCWIGLHSWRALVIFQFLTRRLGRYQYVISSPWTLLPIELSSPVYW